MITAIRHPRPAVSSAVCYGALDCALADPASAGASEILTRLGQPDATRVVCSPLRRAREIAVLLAEALSLPLTIEPRLAEMSFGTWEGQAWDTIARAELDAWARDVTGYRPGGGECADDLMRRVGAVRAETLARGDEQIWVTHAGPIRCLMALAQGRPLGDLLRCDVPFGALFRFEPGSAIAAADARGPASG